MKKYMIPNMEIIEFEVENILTASGDALNVEEVGGADDNDDGF